MNNQEPLGFSYATRDLLISLVVVFMAWSILSLVVHEKAGINPGLLVIEMHWDQASDSDIDLWVKAPGEGPVGFSNRDGVSCNLVRDDQGRSGDPQSNNSELSICRASGQGAWAVNVMAYKVTDEHFPVQVQVTVSSQVGGVYRKILEKRVLLTYGGQQLTVWRFQLNQEGMIMENSVNSLPIDLYHP